MKVFILAVAVFVGISLFVGWESWYVNRMCGEMLAIAERMPEGEGGSMEVFAEEYRAFEKVWAKGEKWLHILSGHDMADHLLDSFTDMGMRYICGDYEGYRAQKEKLVLVIRKIQEGERVTVDSIL